MKDVAPGGEDVISSSVFAQTRQFNWHVCIAPLIMTCYYSYFFNFDLITIIIKNKIILIINLEKSA
jgi:hypothetical protein